MASSMAQTRGTRMSQSVGARPRLRYMDYRVGWICALEKELAAAQAMLDDIHEPLPTASNDTNTYTLGRIGPHNIVLACLPAGASQYGTNNAAIVGANMLHTFQFIDKRLLVGIGGGSPDLVDVRLGDVVVGDQVIQYDLGKSLPGQQFRRTSVPTRPPQLLLTAVSNLQAEHRRVPCQIPSLVSEMVRRHSPLMGEYARPDTPDVLFQYAYDHVCSPQDANPECRGCDLRQCMDRPLRQTPAPTVHLGKIASGNQVIKDGTTRQRIATELGVICFEMEAAGLMSDLSCLVIRGICDYADSHKNKIWQEYAAATAAAYARELLMIIPSTSNVADDAQSQPSPVSDSQDARRVQLHESLRFEEIRLRHDDIKPPLPETCKWFLSEDVFQDWRDLSKYEDHHGFLWISGKPGAGKSTMMKFLYTHARKTWGRDPDTAVVSFFFNARGVELEKSTVGLYRSLLFQIFTAFPDLSFLLERQSEGQCDRVNWTLPVLQSVFEDMIENLGQRQLTCFIDALDECDENQIWNMIDILQDLGNVASKTLKQFYVCLSSRHYPRVEIQPCLRPTLEHQRGHARDIEKYVHSKLRQKEGKAVMDVTRIILNKAAGVFMWVVLVVHILRREFQRGNTLMIKQRLRTLPSELTTLFRDMLFRDDDDLDGLLLCIQWILFAQRPLTCKEFYYALHSGLHREEPGTLQEWDPELVSEKDMAHFVSSTSKGLAEVTSSKKPTVQFIHESVREFLIKDGGMQKIWPQYAQGQDFDALSHDRLKSCCAFYLTVDIMGFIAIHGSHEELKEVAARRAGSRKLLARNVVGRVEASFPFLQYAASHLLSHANSCAAAMSQADFLQQHELSSWISVHNLLVDDLDHIYTVGASEAYIFAANDWIDLLRPVLESATDLWSSKELFSHPLIVASAHGHAASVKLLLATKGVNAQPHDSSGRTPLGCAISNNHEDIVDLLLEMKPFDVSSALHRGRSPLKLAQMLSRWSILRRLICADCGPFRNHADTIIDVIKLGFDVEQLLRAGTSILGVRNQHGLTPLEAAIGRNELPLVKDLIQLPGVEDGHSSASVNANKARGTAVVTALIHAVFKAKIDIVQSLLLIDGISIKSRDESGQTALSVAIAQKHDSVMALFLRTCQFDAESAPEALVYAASIGNDKLVEELLSIKGVDINWKDDDGQTALSKAMSGRHDRVVRMLIIPHRLNAGSAAMALLYAATHGLLETVKRLLSVDGIDINSKNALGKTALSSATMNKHDSVVSILISTGRLDINSALHALVYAASGGKVEMVRSIMSLDCITAGTVNQIALSAAMECGHVPVITLLVDAKRVFPTSTDSEGQSLFSWAMERRDDELLTALVKTGGVNVDTRDPKGLTLLSWAAGNGSHDLLALLMSFRPSHVRSRDAEGRTPLIWAAGNGHARGVAMLVACPDVELDAVDLAGRTPLSWAAANSYDKVVTLLRVREGGPRINAKDATGRSPLSWAAGNGCLRVLSILATCPGIDLNSQDATGRTPLSWAAGEGHFSLVHSLSARREVDMNLGDASGRTPLSWAAENGHDAVVNALCENSKVNVDPRDSSGRTPLSWAAANKVGAAAISLLRYAINVNTRDETGRTPLSWAVTDGSEGTISKLLSHRDIEADLPDDLGRTPLMRLCVDKHLYWGEGAARAKLLLATGAVNVNVQDSSGCTPLMWAASNGYAHLTRLLLQQRGILPDLRDSSGLSARDWARKHDASTGSAGSVTIEAIVVKAVTIDLTG